MQGKILQQGKAILDAAKWVHPRAYEKDGFVGLDRTGHRVCVGDWVVRETPIPAPKGWSEVNLVSVYLTTPDGFLANGNGLVVPFTQLPPAAVMVMDEVDPPEDNPDREVDLSEQEQADQDLLLLLDVDDDDDFDDD